MSDIAAVVTAQCQVGVSLWLAFVNMCEGIIVKNVVLFFVTKVLLSSILLFNSTQDGKLPNQVSTPTQQFLSSQEPSNCLNASTTWTRMFDPSGK